MEAVYLIPSEKPPLKYCFKWVFIESTDLESKNVWEQQRIFSAAYFVEERKSWRRRRQEGKVEKNKHPA